MTTVIETAGACRNCGAGLAGRFCAQCGQEATPVNPPLRHVAREFVSDLFDVDSRMIRSSLLLLTRPGHLTREYFAGRRASYVRPLRLYLTFSVLYFAVAALVPDVNVLNLRFATTNTDEEIRQIGFASEADMRLAVNQTLLTWGARVFFVLVPWFALLVAVVMRRARLHYPQHLVFALHVHAALMAVSSVTLPLTGVTGSRWPAIVAGWYGAIYLAGALRTAYGTTVFGTLWRFAVISPLYVATLVGLTLAILVRELPQIFGR